MAAVIALLAVSPDDQGRAANDVKRYGQNGSAGHLSLEFRLVRTP
jgi:hypothetical protein